jgi:5'-3' exonuclease
MSNELDGLVDFGSNSDINNILLLDYSNIAYRNIFIILPSEPDKDIMWVKWRGKMVYDIMNYIVKFKSDRLVIAVDYPFNWRQKIYPEYKKTESRRQNKAKFDEIRFNQEKQHILGEIKKSFGNIVILNVENCEADDIIAVITEEHKSDNVTIISADHDFCQLSKFRNVTQYDPCGMKKIEVINPEQHINIKVIVGDKNDGIPSIKYGLGPKTAENIWNGGIDNFISNNAGTDVMNNYIRNRTLINFDYIPKEIKDSILLLYKNFKPGIISGSNLMYLLSIGGNQCNSFWNSSKEIFRKLK